MNNLVSLDIETCCNVEGCKGYGLAGTKCDHALSPWHGKITKIGVVGEFTGVFNSVQDFDRFISSQSVDPDYVGHNFKFDLLWLQVHGSILPSNRWAHCTQLMAYVLTEKIPDRFLVEYESRRTERVANGETWHRKAGKHSLKTLAPYFLGVEAFWETEEKDNDEYVLKDAQYTLDLYHVLEKKLKERGEWDFYLRLLSWTKMLLAAELRGISIDLEALTQKELELTQKEKELRSKLDETWGQAHRFYSHMSLTTCLMKYQEMAEKAGTTLQDSPRYKKLYEAAVSKIPTKVDYDSPKQMSWLLRDFAGYNITSLEGDETTGREVLERLANEGKEDVRTFLEWRQTQKLLTAFIPTYKELSVGGIIHPVFNPTNTRTGRTSSERPNLQQVPPDLRGLFKARNGYSFVGYDAAAIEAKLIALYTNDPELNAVIATGQSLHDVNTRLFFGLPDDADIKRDYPVHRAATKNTGFALFYGAGANRLRITFASKGFHFGEGDCRAIVARFKENYKVATEFNKQVVVYMERGEIVRNLLGRPLRIENPEDAYMKAFNMLIQSSASDLNLEGAYRAWNEMKEKGIDATPLLFVHDFVQFEVKEEQVQAANEIIVRNLTNFDLGEIKLTVEGGISNRWSK